MARRRIVDDRKGKRECEKEGGKERKVRGYSWLEIHRQLSFLVVIRVWRERSGTAGRNTRNRDGRRDAGRILRSACKPISISAEIRLSEFPVASGPRGSPRFIGPGSLEFYSLPAKTGPWPTDQTKRFATPDSPVYETHALSIQRTRATAISASFIASTLRINKLRVGRDHGGVDLSSSIWPFQCSYAASYTLRYVSKLEEKRDPGVAHQKLKKTSVNVSAHVNSANTIQYIIHFTWKRKYKFLHSVSRRISATKRCTVRS